jgi:hypothetical protein
MPYWSKFAEHFQFSFLFGCAANLVPKNDSPAHSKAAKSQIAKHDLIHNFSQCSGSTTTCNPATQAARISSTYPNRVGLTTFPF